MNKLNFQAKKHLWLNWGSYWKVPGIYVISGTLPGWFGENIAYIGLSRNIAQRLEMHRTHALSDTHANKAVQNLILNAGETLEFSVLWICDKPWDHGGNYETTLAERWAIKHYTDRTGIKLVNKTRGGELGSKGLGSAVVLVERLEEFKEFKSIKACANFLECTSEKVKKADENQTTLNGWSVRILDVEYHRRRAIKSNWFNNVQDESWESLPNNSMVVFVVIVFIAILVKC